MKVELFSQLSYLLCSGGEDSVEKLHQLSE